MKHVRCQEKNHSAGLPYINWLLKDMQGLYLFALLLSGPISAIRRYQFTQIAFDSTERLTKMDEIPRKGQFNPILGREVHAVTRYSSHQDGQEDTHAHATSIGGRADDKQTIQPNHPSRTGQRRTPPYLPPEVLHCIDLKNQKYLEALWASGVKAVETLNNFEATNYGLSDPRLKNYIRVTSLNCPYQLSKEYKQTVQKAQKAIKEYVKVAENHAVFMKAHAGSIDSARRSSQKAQSPRRLRLKSRAAVEDKKV